MKILDILSWVAKWKFVNSVSWGQKLLPVVKTVVGEKFLADQLHSYAKAKVMIKRVAIGLGITIGIIVLLLITLLVLLIIHLVR